MGNPEVGATFSEEASGKVPEATRHDGSELPAARRPNQDTVLPGRQVGGGTGRLIPDVVSETVWSRAYHTGRTDIL